MKPLRSALRRLTQVTRPLAMRSAGTDKSNTQSFVTSDAARVGRTKPPVVAVEFDDGFLIALPYGARTDWVKNVLASEKATVVTHGHAYEVDRPRVISMTEGSTFFGPKEQKLDCRFAVDTCLRLHRTSGPT
jgi:hypothetical protein